MCGSLAAISAAKVGDLKVSGGADMTWVSNSGVVTGNPLGIGSNYTLSGSGDLDNGWSVGLSIAMANANAYSNTNVTIGIPGIGDIRFDQGVSGTGIQRLDDVTPTVWEEADGAGLSAGINKIMGVSAGTNIEFTAGDIAPAGTTIRFAYSKDADSGQANDKATSGDSSVLGSGWDISATATDEFHGIAGLEVYGGFSAVEQFQNNSAYNGDVEEMVLGVKYAMGGFTVGYQITEEETGQTGVLNYENTSYGVTFSVNDDLSIGYAHTESDGDGSSAADPEVDSFQASYTMGGATFSVAEVQVDNGSYQNTAAFDTEATVVKLGLAF